MKKYFILSLLLLNAVCFQSTAQGVSLSELHTDNEYLLTRARNLIKDAQTSRADEKVDASFVNELVRDLKVVISEGVLRQDLIANLGLEVPKGKNSYNSNKQGQRIQDLSKMQKKLDMQHLYCNAVSRVIKIKDAFSANKKAYFAPGKYLIPYHIRPQAMSAYKSIVDSMQSVTDDFPELKFSALVRTTGYSDASPTPRGSELYNDMVQRMQYDPLEMEEINMYLSYLRSYDVANILEEMTDDAALPKKVKIRFDRNGKGSQLPDYKQNYKVRDSRRRIVKVYWHILPKF